MQLSKPRPGLDLRDQGQGQDHKTWPRGASRPRPGLEDYVTVRDDRSPRFRRQTVKTGDEDGCYREKFRNFVSWEEPDPKLAFFTF